MLAKIHIDEVRLDNTSFMESNIYFEMSLAIYWREFGQPGPKGPNFLGRIVVLKGKQGRTICVVPPDFRFGLF